MSPPTYQSLPAGFPTKILESVLVFPIRATFYPVHHNFIHMTALLMLDARVVTSRQLRGLDATARDTENVQGM
jgi:hypothetical protein